MMGRIYWIVGWLALWGSFSEAWIFQRHTRQHLESLNNDAVGPPYSHSIKEVAVSLPRTKASFSNDDVYRPVFESGLRYKKNDWWRNIVNLPRSYVFQRIRLHLLVNIGISIAVAIGYQVVPRYFSIPMLGHNVLGGFLGLLLVFRQNTAYGRFWEARCTWSKASATARSMAVDVVAQLRPDAPDSAQRMLTLVGAFPDALAYSCLGRSYPLPHNVKKLVTPRVIGKTRLAPGIVLCLMMQETLHEAKVEMDQTNCREQLENLHLMALSHEVSTLQLCLKTCERILNTPVPWSYSRHASRFLTMYTATFPLAVVSTLRWLTILVTAVLCWCLFGIEEIGHLIEQPFVGASKSKRALLTQPYDIGLPVFILSNQARLEVEDIARIESVHGTQSKPDSYSIP